MLDIETRNALKAIEDIINDNIDKLFVDRDSCQSDLIKDYRYVTKKLEHALGMVHKAEERANES
jgi:hypothetical protein